LTGGADGAEEVYVCLLRGVNVGGANRLAMADLRAALAEAGARQVRTLLQSGNAVFRADGGLAHVLQARIPGALERQVGRPVRCVVLTGGAVRQLIAACPLREVATDRSCLQVLVLSAPPDPARLARHDPASLDPDRIRVTELAIYQWCPDGISRAPDLVRFVDAHLGVFATARNGRTLDRLVAML
jgi:uncharacterized protein (DUF1697 family)